MRDYNDTVPYAEYETCPDGTLIARVNAAINLGLQVKQFGNAAPEKKQKLFLVFEVVDESARKADGTPFFLGKEVTLVLGTKATLQQVAQHACGKIDPRKFQVTDLLGQPVQVQVEHKETEEGGVFARITGTTALHPKLTAPPATREPLRWRMGDDINILRETDWLPRVFGIPVAEVVESAEDYMKHYGTPEGDGPAPRVDPKPKKAAAQS